MILFAVELRLASDDFLELDDDTSLKHITDEFTTIAPLERGFPQNFPRIKPAHEIGEETFKSTKKSAEDLKELNSSEQVEFLDTHNPIITIGEQLPSQEPADNFSRIIGSELLTTIDNIDSKFPTKSTKVLEETPAKLVFYGIKFFSNIFHDF